MSTPDPTLERLLEAALDIADPIERDAWISRQCAEDVKCLEELRSLVRASANVLPIDFPLRAVIDGRQYMESAPAKLVLNTREGYRVSNQTKILLGASVLTLAGLIAGWVATTAQRNHDSLAGSSAQQQARPLSSPLPTTPSTLVQFSTEISIGLAIPGRNELACGLIDSHLRVFRIADGDLRLDIDTQQGRINSLAISPDNRSIASAGHDGTVKFWNLDSGIKSAEFLASSRQICYIAWSNDGKQFITAADEPDIRVWSLPSLELYHVLYSTGEPIRCMNSSGEGHFVYACSDGLIQIVTWKPGRKEATQKISVSHSPNIQADRCCSIALSSNCDRIAVGLENGELVLMNKVDETHRIAERVRFPTTITSAVFHRDSSSLALGQESGDVHLLILPDAWPTDLALDNDRVPLGFDSPLRSIRSIDLLPLTEQGPVGSTANPARRVTGIVWDENTTRIIVFSKDGSIKRL
jgi:hypothetical protein